MRRKPRTFDTPEAARARSRAAAALNKHKPQTEATCEVCGSTFTTVDPARARYCGNTCKCRAYRERRDGRRP